MNEVELQRQYYADSAARYESMHVDERDEHYFALGFLVACIEYWNIKSILDVGSGTGRAVKYLKQRCPQVRVVGLEPVPELREQGYAAGLGREDLVGGDALALHFAPGDFDLVCAFGVLHHIRTPDAAIAEMLRVGGKGIFISDSNNFGQGSFLARSIKQAINAVGLWKVANFFKTRGKGYIFTEGDGISYSYSVFNNYKQINAQCDIHLLNTRGGGRNPYREAGVVALLGLRRG